jgi:hypothetical protein
MFTTFERTIWPHAGSQPVDFIVAYLCGELFAFLDCCDIQSYSRRTRLGESWAVPRPLIAMDTFQIGIQPACWCEK